MPTSPLYYYLDFTSLVWLCFWISGNIYLFREFYYVFKAGHSDNLLASASPCGIRCANMAGKSDNFEPSKRGWRGWADGSMGKVLSQQIVGLCILRIHVKKNLCINMWLWAQCPYTEWEAEMIIPRSLRVNISEEHWDPTWLLPNKVERSDWLTLGLCSDLHTHT